MAAGLGFKTFAVGEVLTAADTNGYLMQGVLVFASAAARDAAITSPQEGQFAYTKDTNGLWYYDGAAWVASGATGDIEGVTAGTGISGGGTSGTVTITNSMATAIDAKGDLIVGTGADTFSKLTAGTNGYLLTADSAEATGLKWAAAASSGGMTQLATGTLSGTSVNLSSISASYNNLLLIIKNVTFSSQETIRLRWNGITSATYFSSAYGHTNSTAWNYGGTPNSYVQFTDAATNMQAGSTRNAFAVNFYNYASTNNAQIIGSNWFYLNHAGNQVQGNHTMGSSNTSAAISSIEISSNSGISFSGGDYILWGIK